MRLAAVLPGRTRPDGGPPGRYVLTDRIGRQVGEIQGDYVIGFRSRYEGLQRSFPASRRLAPTSSSCGAGAAPSLRRPDRGTAGPPHALARTRVG